MKTIHFMIIMAAVFLLLAGYASAAGTSADSELVMTNVYFCKIVPADSRYDLQPLLTVYTGENDYGRPTFMAASDQLETGDYALVQDTGADFRVIQVLHIEAMGDDVEDFVALRLEINKGDLPAPLKIYSQADETTAATATTSVPTTSGLPVTTQKSPLAAGLPVLAVLAGAGILLATGRRE